MDVVQSGSESSSPWHVPAWPRAMQMQVQLAWVPSHHQ